MVFIGMDHGTTGISFCIMSDDGDVIEVFKIGREESKQGLVSAKKEILKRVAIGDEGVLKNEDSNVFVSELKDSCIEMGVRCWVKTDEYWPTRWRITENIKLEFDKEGVTIPFPQMEITMKK